ncbi:Arc family DNA-binding protein [Agrobacterium sp. ES01]|uniref:Arc family DNA-binding protein n=1 Tax=Agrobacterium sp. ES01 TaxID=3420714 RepID=UPI003D097BBD
MAENKTGRGSDQFPLRLPEGMRDHIKLAADQAGRSMNAEIVARLEATFDKEFNTPVEIVKIKPIGLNKSDAASLLGVSESDLDTLVQQGRIPPPRTAGGSMIFLAEEFESAAKELLAR